MASFEKSFETLSELVIQASKYIPAQEIRVLMNNNNTTELKAKLNQKLKNVKKVKKVRFHL